MAVFFPFYVWICFLKVLLMLTGIKSSPGDSSQLKTAEGATLLRVVSGGTGILMFA